jgi:hypothetical protein
VVAAAAAAAVVVGVDPHQTVHSFLAGTR